MRPLEGILVLELAQYMAAPSAGLRLADLGARVIKIERPPRGEAGRRIAVKDLFVDGDSLVFHTINRNKESYAANLKDSDDMAKVQQLAARADVLTHNFRPGVMERLGLDYPTLRSRNPGLVYAEVSGYGPTGPWKDKPGQDLLAQCLSGLCWLSGDADDPPTPMGLAVADMLCGAHLAQGILAALVRRARTNRGARVEASLLESSLDFQFEVLTAHLNDGGRLPRRARCGSAHAYLGAPYGVHPTADGYLAVAMASLGRLAELTDCPRLQAYESDDCFAKRDEIMEILASRLRTKPTAAWLAVLEPADVWCANVFDYPRLTQHEAYRVLEFEQAVRRSDGTRVRTTRCPIRIDGRRLLSPRAAPRVGEHNARIDSELLADPRTEAPVEASGVGPAKPLEGLLVVDFGQFLSAPSASLRLADLGARVIKIERPGGGDICRQLYVSNVMLDGESTVFHAINRNKESFAADLKIAADRGRVRRLVRQADVVIHNFRPGVIERLGFGHEAVRPANPTVVYGEVSGYGAEGPWRDKPGQDLLAQGLSGLAWLSGAAGDAPTPMGLAVADIFAGVHLAQGILACLVRRAASGAGGLVQTSLLESALDLQFETLTTFFHDGGQPVKRSRTAAAHAYLGAPYGVYRTRDGWLGLAMGEVPALGRLLGCSRLESYREPGRWYDQRDEIQAILVRHLRTRSTAEWLAILEPADVWCADVLDWPRLLEQQAFQSLGMVQTVRRGDGCAYRTTRCPIRIDGERLYAAKGSPALGEHTASLLEELRLENEP